ncbi:hypothetical protein [Nocardia macrotermitis]|uniref:Uncharacterized protein n=1 Tax=Nocardia macrotermitis TaxID=2585198 RepID=A0A7K0CZC7_9NOCA|nr:hypothetical protein [Nocardia macrotermitis]MQY18829.1 hypothetical protein [Nocardia macrotermitis]
MRVRRMTAGVVAITGFAVLGGVVGAAGAGARPVIAQQQYTCTGTDWAGKALPALTFQIPGSAYQAAHRAQTTWGGVAKFSSIVCQSS